MTLSAAATSPPAFAWEDWYEQAGGRTINIAEAAEYMRRIREDQEPRFWGEVAPTRVRFASPEAAARHLKQKAAEFGADIVGVCEIEPSDVYRGRTVTEKYAVAVGQRMRWREFQVVPSRESAIECLRVYFTLGETVIQLAAHIRSLGYSCTIEHPVGDSDLLHIPIGLKAGFGELGRHGSIIHPTARSRSSGWAAWRRRSSSPSIIRSTPASQSSATRAAPAGSTVRRKRFPDHRSPEAGKDHLGYDRYMVDTGRCFPYFAKYSYCSICLPVCVYNHKEWARDFESGVPTRLFPSVIMADSPPAVDGPDPAKRHIYMRLKR
jgi:hypothetical protein